MVLKKTLFRHITRADDRRRIKQMKASKNEYLWAELCAMCIGIFNFGIGMQLQTPSKTQISWQQANISVISFLPDSEWKWRRYRLNMKLSCFKVDGLSDIRRLQDDIDRLCQWFEAWHLKLNPSKCKVLSLTPRRKPVIGVNVIGKEEIERVEKMRHLGVVLDAKLTFDAREEGE